MHIEPNDGNKNNDSQKGGNVNPSLFGKVPENLDNCPVKWRYRGSKGFLVMGTDDGGEQEIPEEEFRAATKALYEEELQENALLGNPDNEEDEEVQAATDAYLGFPVEYLPGDEESQ